jgi:geranylgeranyl diphosphate synthase type II
MTNPESFLERFIEKADQTLNKLIPDAGTEPKRLHEAIRWSVFAGGKRIRPAIVFAAGGAFGASLEELAYTAAAVEMIHAFSLIHDDLPAMDDDDLRRGRLTCHKKFDEATAILAGDALQVLAFKTLAEDEGLPVEVRVRLVAEIATGSGTPFGMVAGQQLDLEAEGKTVDISQLETIHARKTGALITASAMAGALIGRASAEDITSVRSYGLKLGLLFQITDDLLDVTQSTEILGKTAGKDVSAQKATYPALFGLERSREMASAVHAEACTALTPIDRDTSLLRTIADIILSRSR